MKTRIMKAIVVLACLLVLNGCGDVNSKAEDFVEINEEINQTITFQGMTFSIPAYYDFLDTQSTETNLHYYPQNENYSCSLKFEASNISLTPSEFKTYKQNLKNFAEILEEDGVSVANSEYEEITVAGLPGAHVTISGEKNGVALTAHICCVNNIYQGEVLGITLSHDSYDQSDFDYDGDFVKILESATLTKEGSSESISNKSDENGTSEKPTRATSPSSQEMIGSGDLGDYYVEIKSGQLTEDYEGNPACIINYSWTNNSDETTNAMLSINAKAFQNGVELERAAILSSDDYDSGSSMKDVRPGSTADAQCAFVLANQTSDVEIEFSELFSFTKDAPRVIKIFTIN